MKLVIKALQQYPHTYHKLHTTNAHIYNKVILGIGGNKPHTLRVFQHLYRALCRHPRIFNVQSTPILHNPAFGFTQQEDFENAILYLHTTLNILEMYRFVFYLERRFGRPKKRAFKNAPRVLDIDIIFFNKLILKRAYLTIPHLDWQNRESVCIPMSFMKF